MTFINPLDEKEHQEYLDSITMKPEEWLKEQIEKDKHRPNFRTHKNE
jgi:hypothetical protein